jgi:hypothetical protein
MPTFVTLFPVSPLPRYIFLISSERANLKSSCPITMGNYTNVTRYRYHNPAGPVRSALPELLYLDGFLILGPVVLLLLLLLLAAVPPAASSRWPLLNGFELDFDRRTLL